MGHAIHFLERLQRTDLQETEYALELYNHPRLLAGILIYLNLPDTAERWSLCLSPDPKGPRLILTRDGGFVTCLGRGMASSNLYEVNYERYQVLRGKALERLDTIDRAMIQTKQGTEFERIQERLAKAGRLLTREDIQCLIAFHPLLAMGQLKLLCARFDALLKVRKIFLRNTRSKPEARDLRRCWEYHYALGHHMVLLCHEGQRGFDFLIEVFGSAPPPEGKTPEQTWLQLPSIFWAPYRQGTLPNALRTVWAIGKLGKPVIPGLKKALGEGSSLFFSMSFLGLLCIALRHKKSREELVKFLLSPSWFEDLNFLRFCREMHPSWMSILLNVLQQPEQIEEMSLRVICRLLYEKYPHVAEHYPSQEAIPPEVAFPLFLSLPFEHIRTPENVLFVLLCIPWLARAEAEDLYLPQSLAHLIPPWEAQETLEHLDAWRAYLDSDSPGPYVAPPRVGVNDPCPCGSGFKFKRCCQKNPPPPSAKPEQTREAEEALRSFQARFRVIRDSLLSKPDPTGKP